MVTANPKEGNATIRISLSEEALNLLNEHFTVRKRGKEIERLILKEYCQSKPKEKPKENKPAQPEPQEPPEKEEDLSSEISIIRIKK